MCFTFLITIEWAFSSRAWPVTLGGVRLSVIQWDLYAVLGAACSKNALCKSAVSGSQQSSLKWASLTAGQSNRNMYSVWGVEHVRYLNPLLTLSRDVSSIAALRTLQTPNLEFQISIFQLTMTENIPDTAGVDSVMGELQDTDVFRVEWKELLPSGPRSISSMGACILAASTEKTHFSLVGSPESANGLV